MLIQLTLKAVANFKWQYITLYLCMTKSCSLWRYWMEDSGCMCWAVCVTVSPCLGMCWPSSCFLSASDSDQLSPTLTRRAVNKNISTMVYIQGVFYSRNLQSIHCPALSISASCISTFCSVLWIFPVISNQEWQSVTVWNEEIIIQHLSAVSELNPHVWLQKY